jgi:intein/homing endonuclease
LQSKPIGEVNPGEYVRSRDESTGKDIFIEVKDKHDHGVLRLVEVELETGEKVKCTLDHKFRTIETGEMLPLWQILRDNLSIVVGSHGQST